MLKRFAFAAFVALTIAAAAPDEAGDRPHARGTASFQPHHTCSLYIRTDPSLWVHIRKQFQFLEQNNLYGLNNLNTKIRREILSIISDHVSALNDIYGGTKFDGRLEHRNYKFEVQRIKIDSPDSCGRESSEPSEYCAQEISEVDLLDRHSLHNHEDFCLAYLFTFRNFMDGISGLSWLASTSGAAGGICEKYKRYTAVKDDEYLTQTRSLNTGVFSLAKYNSRVPARVSQLNLAQLIGRSFGSPPGGREGNFIMFRGATAGDQPNNRRFSPCSVGNISAVLDALGTGRKRSCLTASSTSFCGNRIVEPGEECDCGFDDIECLDRCCYPRQVTAYHRERNSTAKGCARKAHTQCSPSQGPCCNEMTCFLTAAHTNTTCREATECRRASHCAGLGAECPRPTPASDPATCNHGTQMCINGECEGSMCLAWNMTQCFLTETKAAAVEARPEANDATPSALCTLACRAEPAGPCRGAAEPAGPCRGAAEPAGPCRGAAEPAGPCRGAAELARALGVPGDRLSRPLPPGSPCGNFQGYCDASAACRPVARAPGARAPGARAPGARAPGAAPPPPTSWFNALLQSITTWIQKMKV